MLSRSATFFVVALLIGAPAYASMIIQPAGVWTDGTPAVQPIGNVINQSGLLAGYNSGVDEFATAITTSLNHWNGNHGFLGDNSSALDNFYFDLGATYQVDGIAIWQQDGSATLKNGRILYSADGSFSSPAELATFSNLPKHPIFPGFQQPVVVSFPSTTGRYFAIDVTANYGYGGFTRLNEVAFRGVPEPAGVVLALVGAAVLLRRRRGV
jgi:hypothetical protein